MDLSSISPPPSTPEQRLDRYLAGAGTPADLAALREQLQRDGIPSSALDTVHRHFGEGVDDSRAIVAAERARLLERVRQANEMSRSRASAVRREPRSFPFVGGIGNGLSLLLLLLIIGAGVWTVRRDTSKGAQDTVRQYATHAGQRATVTFADGSWATLGPATHVSVRSGDRTVGTVVTLDGEALFSVAPNAHAPFSIHAGRSITRVLGTTFLVRRYAADHEARIAVMEGRVSVSADELSSPTLNVLAAGSLGVVSDSGGIRVINNADDALNVSIGTLRFDNTPLYDVAAELSRAYGVEIHVSDSTLAEQRVKWNVQTARTPLDQALEQLPILFDVRVVRSGQIITLVPGRASTHVPIRPSHPFIVEPQHGR